MAIDEITKTLIPKDEDPMVVTETLVQSPEKELDDAELLALIKEKLGVVGGVALRKLLTEAGPKEEPRVQLIGSLHDPEKGIRIELDWNSEFIEHLKANGVTGADEEQIIRRWLAHLSSDIAKNMDEEDGTTSEFE